MKKTIHIVLVLSLICPILAINIAARARMDFDGDGKTDLTVFEAPLDQNLRAQYFWHILRSRDGYAVTQWGAQDNNPGGFFDGQRPADFDGDGKTDIAIYRVPNESPPYTPLGQQCYFYILYSQTNTFAVIPWGRSRNTTFTDHVRVKDYDGDGRADIMTARTYPGSPNMQWWIMQSRDGFKFDYFGSPGDEPIAGDYDGDGKTDLAVARFTVANPVYTFYVKKSSDGTWFSQTLGSPSNDNIYPGDYDGDGKDEIAVVSRLGDFPTYRWRYYRSSDGEFVNIKWGSITDYPVPGDYDGDGTDDIAIYRQGGVLSYFWIRGSSMGIQVWQFGGAQNSPLEGNGGPQ